MAKPEWGMKRTCQSCGTRFYDLMRTPCVCPKCQSIVETEVVFKPRRQSSAEARAAKLVPVAAELAPELLEVEGEGLEVLEGDDVAAVAETDEEDEGLMEDVADLGADDDDMAEVMEHLDDEDLQGEV